MLIQRTIHRCKRWERTSLLALEDPNSCTSSPVRHFRSPCEVPQLMPRLQNKNGRDSSTRSTLASGTATVRSVLLVDETSTNGSRDASAYGHPAQAAIGLGWVQEWLARVTKTPLAVFNSSTNASYHTPEYFPLEGQNIFVDATHDTGPSFPLSILPH